VERPTCEAMLKTFCGVAAVWVVLEPGQIRAKISHLRPVNTQTLNLVGLPNIVRIRVLVDRTQ